MEIKKVLTSNYIQLNALACDGECAYVFMDTELSSWYLKFLYFLRLDHSSLSSERKTSNMNISFHLGDS
jgi:hypothetical protein